MPSSFAIGWSPVSRSMIESRRAARPTGPSTWRPLESGPRWTSVALIASSRRGSTPLRATRSPQIPHMRRESRCRRPASPRDRLAHDAPGGRGDDAEVEAAPSGRRSTRGRGRASRPTTARGPSASARSRSDPGGTTSRCQYAGISSRAPRRSAAGSGRGPTTDMSPRRTFQSCGTSSSCDARSQRPSRVISSGVRAVELGAVRWPSRDLGAGPQRAELAHREDASVAADPLAAVEDGRPGADLIASAISAATGASTSRASDAIRGRATRRRAVDGGRCRPCSERCA